MNTTIAKRLTREDFLAEIKDAFSILPDQVMTFDLDYLSEVLSNAFYQVQIETEERVRQEMLRMNLN